MICSDNEVISKGIPGLAYRMLTRKYGAELVYTQMFSAHCFVESAEYRKSNFQTCPEDRPLVVQFCGNDPQMLLRAAKYVENDCDAVDIKYVAHVAII